jgi:phage protein D
MPHIVPRAEIYIKTQKGKNYSVTRFQKCKLTLSRSLPCDICELTLPKLSDLKLFQENDEIGVILGNDQVGTKCLFKGYISTLAPKNEPVLTAEDYFKTFKEKRNTKYYFDTPDKIAKDVIEFCGFKSVIPNTWESKQHFYWKMQTAAEALANLAQIGWDYFCIPATKKIYFSIPFHLDDVLSPKPAVYVYRFGLNIIESQLEYRTASRIARAIVYVTDQKFRGHSIKYEEGTGDPSKIFNLQIDFDPAKQKEVKDATDQAAKFAKQQIAQSQVSGYAGTFKTFGNPFIIHSLKIKIDDPDKQERSGHYFIDQVIHEISPDTGYKMEISVGGKDHGVTT